MMLVSIDIFSSHTKYCWHIFQMLWHEINKKAVIGRRVATFTSKRPGVHIKMCLGAAGLVKNYKNRTNDIKYVFTVYTEPQ